VHHAPVEMSPVAVQHGVFDMQARKESILRSGGNRGTGPAIGWEHALVPLVLLAVIALWELVVHWAGYPAFILPAPHQVFSRFMSIWREGSLQRHILITLKEIFGGLALGLTVAVVLGYTLAKSRLLERILSPPYVRHAGRCSGTSNSPRPCPFCWEGSRSA